MSDQTPDPRALAELERLSRILADVKQHNQNVTRKWMDERMRAIAAETAAAHWQAEHGRVVEALADVAVRRGCSEWDEPFQKCGLCSATNDGDVPLSHAHDCPLTPAPTGDGPPAAEAILQGMVRDAEDMGLYDETPASREGEGAVAMVTSMEFASEDGKRTATIDRVDEPHVPPLGVTWWLTCRLRGIDQHGAVPYTSRAVAERAAREWVSQ